MCGEPRLPCDALGGERQMSQLGESNKDLWPSSSFGAFCKSAATLSKRRAGDE